MAINIREKVSLKEYTTFKIGGDAAFFVQISSLGELNEALFFAQEKKIQILLLGGGSNMLFSDKGFDGLVIKNNLKGSIYEVEGENVHLRVMAGEVWDKIVENSIERNYSGLENLSGIPGTVGGAPIQNIGAYGVEVKDLIESVDVFDINEKIIRKLSNEECFFSYRNSIFKKELGKKYIVVAVNFLLSKNFSPKISYKDLEIYFKNKLPTLLSVREAVINIRKGKFPDLNFVGTAGSFFKNPIIDKMDLEKILSIDPDVPNFPLPDEKVKISAAYILDKVCQLKAESVGGASLYEKQPLVLISERGATFDDIKNLSTKIKSCVKEKIGIDFEEEVVIFN